MYKKCFCAFHKMTCVVLKQLSKQKIWIASPDSNGWALWYTSTELIKSFLKNRFKLSRLLSLRPLKKHWTCEIPSSPIPLENSSSQPFAWNLWTNQRSVCSLCVQVCFLDHSRLFQWILIRQPILFTLSSIKWFSEH